MEQRACLKRVVGFLAWPDLFKAVEHLGGLWFLLHGGTSCTGGDCHKALGNERRALGSCDKLNSALVCVGQS